MRIPEGSTATSAREDRHLALAGTHNLRHVGGYATASGGRIAERVLWRSDALHALDDEGRRVLRDLPLRTVIDLREDAQRVERPNLLEGVGAEIIALPLFDGWTPSPELGVQAWREGDMTPIYEHIVRFFGHRIAEVAAHLARPRALPALIHCTAGKDRTGVVTALLLAAVGVSDEDIVADFVLTDRYLGDAFFAQVEQTSEAQRSSSPSRGERHRRAEAACIAAALACARQDHGGGGGYLLAHGLAPEALAALRHALVAPPGRGG
jgi:protein-tyrosine phosphatase